MNLYLVQHGKAKSKEEDPLRGLSDEGFSVVRKVAAFAGTMDMEVHQIFHSGKKRALQTAQIMEEHLKMSAASKETDGLAPMDEPGIWFDRLRDLDENIMLVSHLPYLSKLASFILCGNSEGNIIGFEMGGITCLNRNDDGNWTIDWIIKPGMVRE